MKQLVFAAAVVAGLVAFGETSTFTDGAWDVPPSSEADDIVIVSGDLTWGASLPAKVASWTQSGGTVTFQTKYGADPFEVTGNVSLTGGTWTHTANSDKETYRLAVTVGGNFNLGTDATIDVTGCGYVKGKGPGFPGGSAGGCYGGIGTNGSDANCYGSVMRPVNLGSGGNHNAGGGAIALTVGGTLTINGAIVCDGYVGAKGRGDSTSYSGGSGGSVLLVANAFEGAGSVSASGGAVSTGYWGAGGRIALVQTGEATDFSAFTGSVHAWPTVKSGATQDMGAGTVYYETATDGYGKGRVVVDRGASAAGSKAAVFYLDQQEAEFAPSEIALQNGAALKVIGGTRTELEVGAVTGPSDVKLTMTVKDMLLKSVAPAEFVPLTNLTVVVSTGVGFADSLIRVDNGTSMRFDSEVSFDGSVVIGNGSTLTISYPFAVSGDVSVLSGGTITHLANTADTDYRVDLTVGGDLTVAENAGISALAKGWPTKVGPGSGTTDYGGGCHGGRGWNAKTGVDGNGVCYGSLTKPTELGSGTPGNQRPANGGGSVKLTVAGQVINNGIINANGRGASTENSYVCSPAGSIWITCASLSGAGRIEANAYGMDGTTSASNYTLSGGGRVAVWLNGQGSDFSQYTGVFTAYGARTSKKAGGAGTVYLKTGSQAENEGALIIDNALQSGVTPWYTDIGSEVTDAEVGSVIIRNGGYLHMVDGATLTVNGDWTLESTGKFLAEQGGGVAFAGADDSHLSGNTTFSFLSCETPGKALVFADSSTTTIGASGKLVIAGDDENPVVLRSETAETAWNLAVDASAEVSVSDADIYDSDASAGAEVVGLNSTATRCTNWSVSKVTKGETITWTGLAGNTGWGIADNWDLKRPPQVSDLVVIPAGAETMPALSGDSAAVSLTVAAGASLDLAGFAFSVTSNLTVQGELQTVGSEVVTAGGDVTLAAGAIGALPPALLVLNGTAAQTFDANGNRLVAVLVGNASADGVTVASSVAANEWTASGVRKLGFADGVTVTVSHRLTLAGAADAALALEPVVADKTWNLAVKGAANVSHVAVSGSQATANRIAALESTDGGNNTGWLFDAVIRTWVGGASGDFAESANWSGGEVPGEGDSVAIDAATKVTVSAPVRVREIVLGGSEAAELVANAEVEVSESMLVCGGATATLNAPVSVGGAFLMEPGATVTHDAATTLASTKRITLTVGGDMVVPEGAAIDATGKGGSDSSSPGYPTGSCGAGHGSATVIGTSTGDSYGSVFCPTNIGSNARSNSDAPGRAGGGVVKLTVEGVLALDGRVAADGYMPNGDYSGPSGGSIWISAGRMTGKGSVTANGGPIGIADRPGAGGRIALYLTSPGATFEEFEGMMTAWASYLRSDVLQIPLGTPGTIYRQGPDEADFCGTVSIVNHSSGGALGNGEYPSPKLTADPRKIGGKIVMEGAGNLNLTGNATIADIVMTGSKPKLYLNGYRLRVKAKQHALGAATDPDWMQNAQIIPGEDADGNPGTIVWGQIGMIVIMR